MTSDMQQYSRAENHKLNWSCCDQPQNADSDSPLWELQSDMMPLCVCVYSSGGVGSVIFDNSLNI